MITAMHTVVVNALPADKQRHKRSAAFMINVLCNCANKRSNMCLCKMNKHAVVPA
jgi:hypothetical protein